MGYREINRNANFRSIWVGGWGKVLFPVSLDSFRSFFAFNNETFGVLMASYLRTLVDVVFKRLVLKKWTYSIVRNKLKLRSLSIQSRQPPPGLNFRVEAAFTPEVFSRSIQNVVNRLPRFTLQS